MTQKNQIGSHCTKIITQDGITIVTYHNTEVVRFNSDSIVLNSGGWNTNTTKLRMNQTAIQFGLDYSVFQKDYCWYVTTRAGTFTFRDHMIIARDTGEVSI